MDQILRQNCVNWLKLNREGSITVNLEIIMTPLKLKIWFDKMSTFSPGEDGGVATLEIGEDGAGGKTLSAGFDMPHATKVVNFDNLMNQLFYQ